MKNSKQSKDGFQSLQNPKMLFHPKEYNGVSPRGGRSRTTDAITEKFLSCLLCQFWFDVKLFLSPCGQPHSVLW